MTPFKALCNQNPPSLHYQQSSATNPGVKQFVQDMVQMQQLLKDNLLKSQERMKWYAD